MEILAKQTESKVTGSFVTRRSSKVKRLINLPSSLKNGIKKSFNARLIAFPESKKRLRKELTCCEVLGETTDGKIIYLTNKSQSPSLMRELGRLREISFRAVGEGSGKSRDIDHYDDYYEQIILWNPRTSEVVGGYRIANYTKINGSNKSNLKPLYIESLFTLDDSIKEQFNTTVELGRSFIQPKYWDSRNLDHLWMGIGAYLYKHPEVQYMVGPVSMPNHYPTEAKSMICHYYQTYFGSKNKQGKSIPLAQGSTPYENPLNNPFNGEDSAREMKLLRKALENTATPIPTLYKHYTEICEVSGTSVLGFNVDPDFNYCIDALMMVDRSKMKKKKVTRYIDRHAATKLHTSTISSYGKG